AKIVESHNVTGGPSPNEVERMIKIRKEWNLSANSKLSKRKSELEEAYEKMRLIIKSYLSLSKSEPQALKSSKL
ncbi:MAG: hypothetical protein QXJ63_01585, partial [Candidatus Bathyarchaeia archaeon]